MHKKRLDVLMVERGLTDSRSLAQRLVMAGQVRVQGQVALKPSQEVARKRWSRSSAARATSRAAAKSWRQR